MQLSEGNPGAVGIAMAAAQGSVLEDVTVYAAPDSAAGVAGGNGGGGSYKGLTVVGAKYGVDMRTAGSSATYVGLTLVNQTCAAALMDSASTMTATGMRISGSPKLAGVLAGVDPATLEPESGCRTGLTPRLSGSLRGAPPAAVMQSSAGIVDSSIALTPSAEGQAAAACVRAESTLYISDTYLSGCAAAVVPSGRPPIPAAAGSAHTHISLLAMGRRGFNASQPYTYALPVYVDGARQDSVLRMAPTVSGPPANHESRHLWSEASSNAFCRLSMVVWKRSITSQAPGDRGA